MDAPLHGENLNEKFVPYIKEYKLKHSWISFADNVIQLAKTLKK
jgi:hypothetical protein